MRIRTDKEVRERKEAAHHLNKALDALEKKYGLAILRSVLLDQSRARTAKAIIQEREAYKAAKVS